MKAGFDDLGVQERPGIIVLRRTKMPAVLVEAGFLDHPEDNRIFDEQFDQIAQGIADGILTTFSQLKKETEEKRYYQVQVGSIQGTAAGRVSGKGALQPRDFRLFLYMMTGFIRCGSALFLQMDNGVRMEQRVRQAGYPTMLVRKEEV